MCGLMAARALSDHFDRVLVVERDEIEDAPVLHASVPQGRHYHALLLGGQQVLESMFPGFTGELDEAGAVRVRAVRDMAWYFPNGKSHIVSGPLAEARDLGFDLFSQSRGLIEHVVRRRASAVPNVEIRERAVVEGLAAEDGRVTGVSVRGVADPKGTVRETLEADLVVDASGRGSRLPRWLEALGYPAPSNDEVGVDFAYASARFRIPESYTEPERVMFFFGPPPDEPNGAIVGEIEGGLWHVSLAGRFGDYPPGDEEGFRAFVDRLPCPQLAGFLKGAELVGEIFRYRFPTSLQRRYDRLDRHPDGLLAVGDAVCSFNPVYGQGMSSAARQIEALRGLLESGVSTGELPGRFYAEAEAVVRTPWTFATSQDLRFPQTVGERSKELMERGAYVGAVGALAVADPEIHRTMVEVAHLARPFSDLEQEPLRSQALAKLEEMRAAAGG